MSAHAILFRPSTESDIRNWVPVLRDVFTDRDFRVAPEGTGNPADIRYLITWGLKDGDKTAWPNVRAVLGLGAGINQYVGHPQWPAGAQLVRMIDEGLERGMAEYVTAYVLRLYRDFDRLAEGVRAHDWDYAVPPSPDSVRVGIMGLGRMGGACIDALRPFGFGLRGWSRTSRHVTGVECFTGGEELENFLRATDILVCLLPLTPQTEGILNARTLGLLPRGAALINAARGKHLAEGDLIPLLDSGHLRRAVLDVLRKEPPPPDHPFLAHPRIHITPHCAAITIPQTGARTLRQAIDRLERGENPPGLVDISRGY